MIIETTDRGVQTFADDNEALIAALRIAMHHDGPHGTASLYVGPNDRQAYQERKAHFGRLAARLEQDR